MAVTITNLTSGGTLSDATSFNTASVSPSANKIILLSVRAQSASGGAVNSPTATGNGITWTQITTVNTVTDRRLTLFRGISSSPTSGAITIDFAGQSQTSCDWSVNEVSNSVISGSNGADAIVQNNTANQTGTHTGIAVTLSAFSNINNATFGVVMNDALIGITKGANFTELSATDGGTKYCENQYAQTNQTTVDWTWGSVSSNADYAIAIEIKAASTGGSSFLLNFV